MNLIQQKAIQLGISEEDILLLTDRQLANEVRYASLNSSARNNLERGQVVVCGITRVTMPEPILVRRKVA